MLRKLPKTLIKLYSKSYWKKNVTSKGLKIQTYNNKQRVQNSDDIFKEQLLTMSDIINTKKPLFV